MRGFLGAWARNGLDGSSGGWGCSLSRCMVRAPSWGCCPRPSSPGAFSIKCEGEGNALRPPHACTQGSTGSIHPHPREPQGRCWVKGRRRSRPAAPSYLTHASHAPRRCCLCPPLSAGNARSPAVLCDGQRGAGSGGVPRAAGAAGLGGGSQGAEAGAPGAAQEGAAGERTASVRGRWRFARWPPAGMCAMLYCHVLGSGTGSCGAWVGLML